VIVGITIDPACFGPSTIVDLETRMAAEKLLAAALSNAVFLCDADPVFSSNLISHADQLNTESTKLGEQLLIRTIELRKQRRSTLASIGEIIEGTTAERLRKITSGLRGDIVVCANDADIVELADLSDAGIEVCSLLDYENSATERKRLAWNSPQGLEEVAGTVADEIIGRAVMFSHELIFVDRYIGVMTRDKRITARLKEAARAIVYVSTLWRKVSPYSGGRKATVLVITEGGMTGADGYVDAQEAERLITLAVKDEDSDNNIRSLSVEVKQESDPACFKDRFIKAGDRCWQIGHSISSLDNLRKAPGARDTIAIYPDCLYFRKVVAGVRNLPSA
jgi:hypothetical protein